MANHKSAIKRHRQSIKRRDRNRETKSAIKDAIKKARQAADKGDAGEAKKLLVAAERAISKAKTKRVLHKSNASRKISRLSAYVAKKAK